MGKKNREKKTLKILEVRLPFLEKTSKDMSFTSYKSLLPLHHLNVIKGIKWNGVKAYFLFIE